MTPQRSGTSQARESFGELAPRQQASARRLREGFLANVPAEQLEPLVERLT
jgi:hypothetical protein